MDSELRAVLLALAEGQIKLSEGQTHLTKGQARLAKGQIELSEGLARLTQSHIELSEVVARLTQSQIELSEGLARLDQAMVESRDEIKQLVKRMDGYTQAVTRGLTASIGRDVDLQSEVESLKGRVTALEKRLPPKGGPDTPKRKR